MVHNILITVPLMVKYITNAVIFCHIGSTAFRNAHFGPGSGGIFMDDVHCSGSESQLRDCPHISNQTCDHDEDASVQCQTGSGYALSIAVYQLWE